MRKAFIDFGFNAVPLDPQTPRRDFWGAVFIGALAAAAGFAAAWAGLGQVWPTKATAWSFLFDLSTQQLSWHNTSAALATRGGVALLCAAVLGVLLFVEAFKPRERVRHVRGRRYLDGKDAIQKARQILNAEISDSAQGVPLSQDFNFSTERETTHTLIVGGVGAGKTTIAHHILKGC